jgi:signal transduction histidine kinase
MMFHRISRRIALQFTAFVFLLLLVNGMVFLAVDFGNARRDARGRLVRTLELVTQRPWASLSDIVRALPPPTRERVRIVDPGGVTLYGGGLFDGVPFRPVDDEGFSGWTNSGERYDMLTAPITRGGQLEGFIQVAEVQRFQSGDLPRRALIYLLVSAAVSLLTYVAGVAFARRSLKPAVSMVEKLEQFTQDASHELRTPLAMVNSSLDLAVKTKRYEEGIASAKDDLRRISVLVERLLELTRLEELTISRRDVALAEVVAEVVAKHRPMAAERGMTIEEQLVPARVKGDGALLYQAVANLLSNAIKFGAPGGKVIVRLTPASLSVSDDGPGIAPEALPHLFDRFYRADVARTTEGFGLGLALVKRIVDLHGWSVSAASEPGNGSTFTIGFSGRQ